jgi:crotonobetainyl-CoA:carnitine CoA-transferase CaiB-like acyl-CoA transferase
MLPLENIKVLDLSHLGPGMICSMMLADFGAEVVNICSPKDVAMNKMKDFKEDIWSFEGQIDLMRESMNRNKKSVMLDLKSQKDLKIFLKMSKEADIILEDFRPGVVKRLGIDYQVIKDLNPGIVYCSLSGYGQSGPYRDLPGHDINFTGMSGVLDLIGEKGGPPVIPMFFIADFAGAALHSVIGILLSLYGRVATGQGQFIDISFVDSAMTLLTPLAYAQLNYGITPRRGETLYSGSSPCYAVYKCADEKYLTIGCFEPWLWENLCKSLSVKEFTLHQFSEGEKKAEIFDCLQKIFKEKKRDEWFQFLKDKNVCVGKVYSLDEVFEDPQILQRYIVQEVKHPIKGIVKHLGPTIKLSGTPGQVRHAAPRHGENTEEVLKKYV